MKILGHLVQFFNNGQHKWQEFCAIGNQSSVTRLYHVVKFDISLLLELMLGLYIEKYVQSFELSLKYTF